MSVGFRRNGRGALCPGVERYINRWVERKKERKRKEEIKTFEKPGKFSGRTNHRPAEILIRPIARINRGALLLHRTARYE